MPGLGQHHHTISTKSPEEPRFFDQGLQHRELGVEAHRRRDAREREHEEQHHEREPRAARIQAPEIREPGPSEDARPTTHRY